MKHEAWKKAILKHLFAAATALIMASTVAAQEKKPSPPVKLTEIRKHLGELQTRIAETIESLNQLKKAARNGSDLLPSYTAFDNQLKELEPQIAKVRAESTRMRARADDYYRAWQSELDKVANPELREKAQNRFQDAKEDFGEIIAAAEEVKRSLGPFIADLKDVNAYLSTDLSTDAVKSLFRTILQLDNRSMSVIGSLQHVSGQISRTLELLPEGK